MAKRNAGSEGGRTARSRSRSRSSVRTSIPEGATKIDRYPDSELVIGLVAAVGTDLERVRSLLVERLKHYGYECVELRITKQVIPAIVPSVDEGTNEYERLDALMNAGNRARESSGRYDVLALGAAAFINNLRAVAQGEARQAAPRRAYVVRSLKHPKEVERLREIYAGGFYLLGVHSDESVRLRHLEENRRIAPDRAKALIDRDQDEFLPHGQKVAETFHLSDIFIRLEEHESELRDSIRRALDLMFGNPFVTPTFDEYAMFLAFAASLRSADLSRQVGAVVAVDEQVVAMGANDSPRAGGGLYWPERDETSRRIVDAPRGRDYMRGEDSNRVEQLRIIDDIVDKVWELGVDERVLRQALEKSRVRDLTEFGRVVHAEMEALLSCARARIAVKGGTVYSTTFPCHNCAKHIIAAGIERVVFIEPYQKSKAAEFHDDSIELGARADDRSGGRKNTPKVLFEPFVGIGPRRFMDLFSTRLGSGYPLVRKDGEGKKRDWSEMNAVLRLQMLPASYLDLELEASESFKVAKEKVRP